MDFAAFGAGSGPPIELLSAPKGQRIPYPIQGNVAFDDALARVGWVVLSIGERLIGVRDGELMSPFALPRSRAICAAADATQVMLQRDLDDADDETAMSDRVVELVSSDGDVLQQVGGVAGRVVGQLRSGAVVTRDALVTWEGASSPLPVAGRALAVCDGRYLVLLDGSELRVLDVDTGASLACDASGERLSKVVHDAEGVSAAFPLYNVAQLPVVVSGEPKIITVEFVYHSCVWLDRERILLVGDDEHCLLDVRDESTTRLPGLPSRCHPRVVVTGRFDVGVLRRYLRQHATGQVRGREPSELVADSRDVIVAAAASAGIGPDALLDLARPAVFVDSLPPPSRVPLGATRLGGRPDLPTGSVWPSRGGEPLTFLAQLRCDELSAVLPDPRLPDSGLLSFFAQLGYGHTPIDATALVIHTPQSQLRRLSWPQALPPTQRLEVAAVSFRPGLTLPDWSELDELLGEQTAERVLDALPRRKQPHHQLLGHNSSTQGHPPPLDHELLLRLDSDTYLNAMFGDGGSLLIFHPASQSLAGATECIVDVDGY